MTFYDIARWGQLVDARSTCFHFKHSLAAFAEKVMMVMLMLTFIMRRGTWNFHHFHLALIHKDTKCTVNSGDTQPGRQSTSHLPYFGGGHGSSCIL